MQILKDLSFVDDRSVFYQFCILLFRIKYLITKALTLKLSLHFTETCHFCRIFCRQLKEFSQNPSFSLIKYVFLGLYLRNLKEHFVYVIHFSGKKNDKMNFSFFFLDLSRNRFCELPEEVASFSFMETLLLYHNSIRSLSASIKSLTSLTYLDLRSNQLTALPREVCFLPLQVLLVSNNRLTSLPDDLGRMERLTDLDASYNQLTTLPARIGDLRSLRSFSLRSNQLMYLPRELTYLSLVSLDVSSNRISSLPTELRQMTTLTEFNLEHNPMTSPPASLCVRGLVHVFKFLETQATKDERGKSGGNYDGYTTLRRTNRTHSANVPDTNTKPNRQNPEFNYNLADTVDKRWSSDVPPACKFYILFSLLLYLPM